MNTPRFARCPAVHVFDMSTYASSSLDLFLGYYLFDYPLAGCASESFTPAYMPNTAIAAWRF